MYLLGCLGYLLYYLLCQYKWFHNRSKYQPQIELNISKPPTHKNFSDYIEMHANYLPWEKLHRSPFSETNW